MGLLKLQDKRDKRLMEIFKSLCDIGVRPEKALKRAKQRLLEEDHDKRRISQQKKG